MTFTLILHNTDIASKHFMSLFVVKLVIITIVKAR